MSVFLAEIYSVSPEKIEQLAPSLQRAVSVMEEEPKEFTGLKFYQAYSQMAGTSGGHVEVREFGSMNDIDTLFRTMFGDEQLKQMPQEFFTLSEPGKYHTQVWTAVVQYRVQHWFAEAIRAIPDCLAMPSRASPIAAAA
jgi:hypothetical protein